MVTFGGCQTAPPVSLAVEARLTSPPLALLCRGCAAFPRSSGCPSPREHLPEAAAAVPQWPGTTCLYLLVTMNIIPCTHSTASLAPFGMKNMSPLDVSTGLCRTQNKNVDPQIYLFIF